MSIARHIARPLTSPITRAVTDRGVGGFSPVSISGLQVLYDRSDLSTMFQGSADTTSVTAVEQPVGLALDKRLGLARGAELLANGTFDAGLSGWALGADPAQVVATWIAGRASLTRGSGANAGFSITPLTAGRLYEVTFELVSGNVALNIGGNVSTAATPGLKTARGVAAGITLAFWPTAINSTAVIDNVSAREILGNHAKQATAAARPIYRNINGRPALDFDAIDDSHVTTFPAALGSTCTVARSIPGVGAQILTAQTVDATFTDTTDSHALAIYNRALTAAETASLTAWLNARAGL